MKLHDLRPAPGSHTARTRVGRGIAAGKGKTAGRGTKGQKARAGGSIPPWFEGGQTPLHMRLPKLRGFKNRFKTDYEVVNVGAIAALAEQGVFSPDKAAGGKKSETVTINQDILRAVGLVRTLKKPLKILGNGELTTALFVVADAFTKSAAAKIEAAGGTVSVLEVPTESVPAIGVDGATARPAREPRTAAGRAAASRVVSARAARDADTEERAVEAAASSAAKASKEPKEAKEPKAAKTPKEAKAGKVSASADADADADAEAPAAVADIDAADQVEDFAPEPVDDAPNPADGADTTEDADAADDENA
jgi:large subunit ribosomal protein L15